MERTFKVPVTSVCSHPVRSNVVALGFIDGKIACYTFHLSNIFNEAWSQKLKRAIRAVEFSVCGSLVFSISANKAICVFDFESGQRLRCIKKSHSQTPNTLCTLPNWIPGQMVASGAEDGEVQ